MSDLAPAADARRPDDRRGRGVRLVVVLVLFFLVAGTVYAAVAKYQDCREPPPPTGQTIPFDVPEGATGKDVVERLHAQGLINCGGFLGNLLLRGTGKAGDIRGTPRRNSLKRVEPATSSRSNTTVQRVHNISAAIATGQNCL